MKCNFQTDFSDWLLRHVLWNCPTMNVTGLHWWSVNIASGNGLVPSARQCWPRSTSPNGVTGPQWVNSLQDLETILKNAIFNLVLLIGILSFPYNIALRWMPRDLIDDKPTLVQAMAWCSEATSHNRSQCWPSSVSPFGITTTHWLMMW